MMELHTLSLTEAAAALRRGETTSVELTRALLGRIEAHNPALNAFLTVTGEWALELARRADGRIQSGAASPLTGIPLAIKDVICVQGVPATAGSLILKGYRPPYHATVIEKLLAAGVVILGKTNTDEFAMGSSTENSAYGVTHNPWDPTRVPGGSSGGSAAAVAAGLAFGALGSDTGGSVRQPAAFCGVVGLKPSYGRVSRYGLIAFASSLDQIGVFARTAEDAALLLGAIAGHDPRDGTSMPTPVPDYAAQLQSGGSPVGGQSLRGLRVGLPKEYFVSGVEADVSTAVSAAVKVLEGLGAQAREVSLPHTEQALSVYYIIAPAEASANLARFDGVRYGARADAPTLWDEYRQTRGAGFGAEVKRRIMLGTYALSTGYYDAYYLQAQKVRTLIKGDFDSAFDDVDVIACPTSPTTAFKIGEKADDPLAMYLADVFTLPANLAGIAGVSVNCGFDRAGLPVGLQLLGPAFIEDRLLRVAHVFQQTTEWHTKVPAL
ncbi:MAG: Asp-tRNA(Asn)/Glu-tRNA(Gln) amidotransferase subunit GatA [Chloroflexi bacterium]|nr:Asp-tRNA(Asn)/Glu-tRNA(Gln) amidotransferase subunit GatA [Chloroflexota bacterium]